MGLADSDGKDHNFGTYKKAKQTMELFLKKIAKLRTIFTSLLMESEMNFRVLVRQRGSASGVSAYDALAKLYLELIDVDSERSELFDNISGYDAIPLR